MTLEFKDTGILPETSPYYQEGSDIFFHAINHGVDPSALIAALLRLKHQKGGDETLFIEGMRLFDKQIKEQLEKIGVCNR